MNDHKTEKSKVNHFSEDELKTYQAKSFMIVP